MASRIPVLIISKYFPPTLHVAAQRPAAFARYLDPTRFAVHVLTLGADRSTEAVEHFTVHRVPVRQWLPAMDTFRKEAGYKHLLRAAWNFLLRQLTTDIDYGIHPSWLGEAERIIREQNVRVLITTYGPPAVIRLGLSLKERFPNLFWVSDLRDSLVQAADTRLLRARLRRIQRKMLGNADGVTVVSAPMIDGLREGGAPDSGHLSLPELLEVRNGYDFEPIREPERRGTRFTLAFAGTLYQTTHPQRFYDALLAFIGRQGLMPHEFCLWVIGGNSGMPVPERLRPYVETSSRVPYRELPLALAGASAFLVLVDDYANRGTYTGKVFDYLAVNRPILALVDPTDVCAALVNEAIAGYVADYHDPESIDRTLDRLYQDWKNGLLPQRDWEVVESSHRRHQVDRLSSLLIDRSRTAAIFSAALPSP